MDSGTISALLPLVLAELKKKRVPTKVAGFDAWIASTVQHHNEFPPLLMSRLAHLNVHGYTNPPKNGTDPRRYMEELLTGMSSLAQKHGKEVWVSESGPLLVSGGDLDVGLFQVRTIIQNVNLLEASAWSFWQAVGSTGGLKWSFLAIPYSRLSSVGETQSLSIIFSKKYYMMKQLVQGAPRGSRPLVVGSDGGCHHCIAAFHHEELKQLAVFIVNQRSAPSNVTVYLSSFVLAKSDEQVQIQMFRTSELESAALIIKNGYDKVPGSILIPANGLSFTSVILSNVDSALPDA
eukprot:TRINITY_DN8901_c0_g1_i1.p1 TRINITY_DN8901_c0_g1~~TRINITY_DN8901_c0_g1_i1.p1  ORF type:complete len:311 (-),score=-3.51 TRINITY_DN8901_c0_g1_i1:269-1144(-)